MNENIHEQKIKSKANMEIKSRMSQPNQQQTKSSNPTLKTQGQISNKQCVKEYCSCDKTCQFSAFQGIYCRSYLEKLTIGNKFMFDFKNMS